MSKILKLVTGTPCDPEVEWAAAWRRISQACDEALDEISAQHPRRLEMVSLARDAAEAASGAVTSGLHADDAAWAEMAATAERNLRAHDLSEQCAHQMRRMIASCRQCAGLPPRHSSPAGIGA